MVLMMLLQMAIGVFWTEIKMQMDVSVVLDEMWAHLIHSPPSLEAFVCSLAARPDEGY